MFAEIGRSNGAEYQFLAVILIYPRIERWLTHSFVDYHDILNRLILISRSLDVKHLYKKVNLK